MVKELAGHYSSVTEPDEWKIGTTFAMTFNPSLVITALKTVRILGINSKANYAPEKMLDTVMPVPEEFLLSQSYGSVETGTKQCLPRNPEQDSVNCCVRKHGNGPSVVSSVGSDSYQYQRDYWNWIIENGGRITGPPDAVNSMDLSGARNAWSYN